MFNTLNLICYYIIQEIKKWLKMKYIHLVLCILLVTEVVTGFFDTSYYNIISDPYGENFSYFSARCSGSLNLKIFHVILTFYTFVNSCVCKLKNNVCKL